MTPAALAGAAAGALAGAGIACVIASFAVPPADVPRPQSRWRALLARWRISPRLAAAAVAAGAAVLGITGWPVAGLAAVPAVIALPRILSQRPARARIARLEALEAWTRRLGDVLAASRGLEDAIIGSAATAPLPVRPAVTSLAGALRTRVPAEEALRGFADAVDDPVGDLVATALLLAADRRGPGVRAVLTELAGDVGRDVAARREAEAERASYRTALAWIVAFVIGYTAYLVLRPSYSAPFGTPIGQFVLALVAACYGGGLYWLHQLSLTTGPGRFLRRRTGAPAPAAGQQAARQP